MGLSRKEKIRNIILIVLIIVLSLWLLNPFITDMLRPLRANIHIKKLELRTEERFADKIASGEIVDYSVDVIYSFDGEPDMFVVEIEYATDKEYYYGIDGAVDLYDFEASGLEESVSYSTKYEHIVGYIEDGRYVLNLVPYGEHFMQGRSIYSMSEIEGKKYYGSGVFAVEKEGILYHLIDYKCQWEAVGDSVEFHVHEKGKEKCNKLDYKQINHFKDEAMSKKLVYELKPSQKPIEY